MHPRQNVPRIARYPSEVTGTVQLPVLHVGESKKTYINPLTPNDPYRDGTAPLTKRCILYIYSTNIGTEYFKHGIYCPFFSLSSKCSLFHNSNVFSSCISHIFIQVC